MSCETACPTCASLRAASVQLVGERGLSGLSTAGLCAYSGVPRAVLAMHYGSAGECLGDAYDELADEIRESFAESLADSASWADGLMLGLERMLVRMAENPGEARLCFVETLSGDRDLMRRRQAARRRMIELLSAERRRRDAWEPTRIQQEMILGVCFQLISARAAEGRIDELPELIPELAELTRVFEPVAA